MSRIKESPIPLNYAVPKKKRQGFILKWLFFAGAIAATVGASVPFTSFGAAAAGLWIAFALIYVQEMKSDNRQP